MGPQRTAGSPACKESLSRSQVCGDFAHEYAPRYPFSPNKTSAIRVRDVDMARVTNCQYAFSSKGLLSIFPASEMVPGTQDGGKLEEDKVPWGNKVGGTQSSCFPVCSPGKRFLEEAATLAEGYLQTPQRHTHGKHGTGAARQGCCH